MQTTDKSFESVAKFKFVNYINYPALHAWRNEEEAELRECLPQFWLSGLLPQILQTENP